MPYIGKTPTAAPLSASDLDDDIISLAKMASGTDGNLITYDASGNPVAVATGDDGQILTSAGAGQPCAFEAAAGGGKVLQVVTATDSTERSTTSTSWVTGSNTLSASITPSATTSKILILTNFSTTGPNSWNAATVYRDATNLGDATYGFGRIYSQDAYSYISTAYLDSPSSTSSLTYQAYFRVGIATKTALLNGDGTMGTITLMEIGA